MASATIKLFLANGDPKRLRTAEISNWTGKAVAGPRSEFGDLVARVEAEKSGIYFLTGGDPESGSPAIYIGEAEVIRTRIKAHVERDFWNQAVFFVSKDENLTKAHVRYLEGRLIELANKAGRSLVTNGQGSGARLPESDREDMEVFLDKICQLLPVLGVDALVPAADSSGAQKGRSLLECAIKGRKAKGYRTATGFLVLRQSEAVLEERASSEKWRWPRNMRQSLLQRGILKKEADRLVFLKNCEFASPSAAAAVVHGGHANGLTAWKSADGKTLKQLESV